MALTKQERCSPSVMFHVQAPRRQTDLMPNVSLYSPDVLVNNWAEDRSTFDKPPPGVQHYRTVYSSDFRPPYPQIPRDQKDLLDRIIQHGGRGHSLLITHGGPTYEKNIATTHDLMYNHFPGFPEKLKFHSFPKFIPKSNHYELLDCYGNVTKYGLGDYKKYLWDLEERANHEKNTEYMARYVAPRAEDMESVRVAVAKRMSSAVYDVNVKNRNATFRGRRVSVVPDGEVDVERYRPTCGLSCLEGVEERHRGRCPPC